MNFCCCSLAGTAACDNCMNRPSGMGYIPLPRFEYDFNPNTGTVTPATILIGWICPRCCKVHAPDIKTCDCKPPQQQIDGEEPYTGEGLIQPMDGLEEEYGTD